MEKVCYNPYHFVPTPKRGEAQRNDLAQESLREEEAAGATTHERNVRDTHSGRLECKPVTKTPLVVGARLERSDGKLAVIEPYSVDERPAIPG